MLKCKLNFKKIGKYKKFKHIKSNKLHKTQNLVQNYEKNRMSLVESSAWRQLKPNISRLSKR